jgi:hypothetical protein
VLALEKEDTVVIATDDRNAIRACKVLRIGFVTSLGRDEIIEEVSRQIGGMPHGEGSEDG